MKKYLNSAIMAVTAIVFAAFSSCNTNDGPDSGEAKRAILKISLANPTMKVSRASGTLPADNTVTEFSVFVFNVDGSLAAKRHFATSGAGNEEIDVTTNAKEVYVIANAGDQTANFSTKAALTTTAVGLVSTQYTLTDAKRWATGNAELGAFSNDQTPVAEATVALKFIAARITLTVNNQMTGTADPEAAVISNVIVLNGRGQSKLFPVSQPASAIVTSLIPQSSDTGYAATSQYLEGVDVSTFTNKPDTSLFTAPVTEMLTAYSAGSEYYFYVFENDGVTAATFPTIVTLVASNSTTTAYYPIHLAPYETFTTGTMTTTGVVRGNSYNLTITLTGDATTAISRGTDDPTKPLLSAHVNVTLDLSDWTAVPLGKNF